MFVFVTSILTSASAAVTVESGGKCEDGRPFGQRELWTCAIKLADRRFQGNSDGKVSYEEMKAVFDHYLSWLTRTAFTVAMGNLRDRINDCAPGPGASVTWESFTSAENAETCFPAQWQRCKVRDYICDVAAKELKVPVY